MSDPVSMLEGFFDDKEKQLDIQLEGGPLFWDTLNELIKEEASKFITLEDMGKKRKRKRIKKQ